VRHLRSVHFVIERSAPGLIHTDGETHETGATVEVVVRPCSLRLVVPAACSVAAASRRGCPPPSLDDRGYSRYARLALKKLEKRGTEVLYGYSP
jgi:hypothetical protein